MKKENYYKIIESEVKDISASQNFNFLINIDLHNYESAINDIKKDVNTYIITIENDDDNLLSIQKEQKMNPSLTYDYFRKRERSKFDIWILQYLIAFLSKLPLEEDIEEDLVDPFHQFKSFILYNINLLTKDDVKKAIFRSLREQGTLDTNMPYYVWWIKNNINEMIRLVQGAGRPLINGWRNLFIALQRLCMFWFSLKNQDFKTVRKGDVFMYILTRILLKRLNIIKNQKTSHHKT